MIKKALFYCISKVQFCATLFSSSLDIDSPSVWTPWKEIADDIPIQRTSQGDIINFPRTHFQAGLYSTDGLTPAKVWLQFTYGNGRN